MAPHFLRLMLGFAEPVRAKAGSVSGSEDVIECPFPKSRSLEAARRLVGCRAPLRYHHDVDQLTIRSNSARSQAQSLHTAAPELNVLQEYTTDVSKKKQPVTVYLCHVGCARRSLPLPLQIFKNQSSTTATVQLQTDCRCRRTCYAFIYGQAGKARRCCRTTLSDESEGAVACTLASMKFTK